MRRHICHANSVRPSVCLSVTRVYCIKTAERIIEILSRFDRPLILVFRHEQGRSQDFSLGAAGRAPKARENRRAEGAEWRGAEGAEVVGCEECVPLRHFLNFYIKMVSFGAFWVAVSYRLAACFTRIGSTCGTEIYWRSFRHFGNYN